MARRNDKTPPPAAAPASPFGALAALRGSLPPGTEPAPANTTQASPFAAKVVINRERKGRGGKTATLVRGVQLTGAALDAFAREMRQALGTGGSVEDGAIVIAGDQCERAAAWLSARGAPRVVIGN